jgi:polyhydroxyalkanoate synthesis regulator phasin
MGVPEPLARNTRRSGAIDTFETLEPRTAARTRRQTRQEDDYAEASSQGAEPVDTGASSGRVTTKEIRKIIEHLQHTINEQTALIQATRTELREVKHNQNELQTQNEKLQEEIRALRSQVDGLNRPTPTRPWATVVANAEKPEHQENHRRAEKEKNCVRISTQRSPSDTADTEGNGNEFSRYLPIPAVNNHIRTALLNAPSTQDVQVAGIGTTKTG